MFYYMYTKAPKACFYTTWNLHKGLGFREVQGALGLGVAA